MIKVETIELIRQLIINLIVYIPVITIAGFFGSWIISKLGDSTPEENGFLSLNPASHIDPIGILFMLIPPHIPFSKSIPINGSNIQQPFKMPKIILLFFAKTISYFVILVSSIFFFSIFQYQIVNLKYLQTYLSLLTVIVLIFRTIIGLTIFLLVIHFISGIVRSFIYFFLPKFEEHPNYLFFLFVLPIIILFLFGSDIESILRLIIINIDHFFKNLLS